MGPALLIAFLILAQSPKAARSDNGTIEGTVLRVGTKAPIPRAEIRVTAEDGNSSQILSAVADQDGRFSISEVLPGRYRVSSRHTGYLVSPQSSATVTVKKREQIRDVGLWLLPPPGRVQGKVVRPDGSPASGVSVQLAQLVNWGGLWQLHKSGHETQTDFRGEYRFEVPPGSYYVRTVAFAPFARTYFPDTTDAAKAVAIEVRDDSDTTVDIHPSQVGFKISGRVVDPHSGAGDRDVSIFLANRGATIRDDGLPLRVDLPNLAGPVPNVGLRDLTQPFELGLVSPGAYDLHVLMFVRTPVKAGDSSALYRAPVGYYVGRAAVDVTDSDVTGIEIVPGKLIEVKGQIVSSGRTIEKLNQKWVILTPLDSNPFRSSSLVDKNGRFTAYLREGSYQLGLSVLSPDAYVVDVLQGGKSILDSGFVVTRGVNDPIRVIVNPKGAVIRGSVTNGPEALIYLASTNGRNRLGAQASKTGDFILPGIPPGDYVIFAFPLSQMPETSNPDFLTKYGSQGTPIKIKDETLTITLPLTPR